MNNAAAAVALVIAPTTTLAVCAAPGRFSDAERAELLRLGDLQDAAASVAEALEAWEAQAVILGRARARWSAERAAGIR